MLIMQNIRCYLNLVEVIDVVKEGEQRTKQMIRISEHMMDSESQN